MSLRPTDITGGVTMLAFALLMGCVGLVTLLLGLISGWLPLLCTSAVAFALAAYGLYRMTQE